MIKKNVAIIVSVLMITAVAVFFFVKQVSNKPTSAAAANIAELITSRVQSLEKVDLLQKDGREEVIVRYKTPGNYFKIFVNEQGKWKELSTEQIYKSSSRISNSIEVLPFAINGEKTLLIVEENTHKYYVVQLDKDKLIEASIEKGYEGDINKYLTDDEKNSGCEAEILEVYHSKIYIIEKYGVYCRARNYGDPHRFFTLIQKPVWEGGQILKFAPKYQNDEQLHSGYFILDDYLWHDGKKLINESFKTWYDPQENPDVEYGEWFQRSDDKYVYFYIAAGGGCGGCFWKEDSYLMIDKSNDEVTKKKLKSNGNDGKRLDLFEKPADRQILSNDKEKVAYVTFDKKSNQQAVYVYDFIGQSATKIKEISTDEFLYKCEMMCEFEKDALYWDDFGKLIINPHKKQEGVEYYFR